MYVRGGSLYACVCVCVCVNYCCHFNCSLKPAHVFLSGVQGTRDAASISSQEDMETCRPASEDLTTGQSAEFMSMMPQRSVVCKADAIYLAMHPFS